MPATAKPSPTTADSPADAGLEPGDAEGLPGPVSLAPAEREHLLELARLAIAVATGTEPVQALDAALDRIAGLDRPAAAFVTLTRDGDLRGCIGSLDASRSVGESVASAAVSAALHDPRFERVVAEELPSIHLEVSVLGPVVPLADPERFRLGIDGLVVERGWSRGLLLPEVATMHGLDRRAMLETTCRKAGLPRNAWRERGTTVSAFRTDRFGGPAIA